MMLQTGGLVGVNATLKLKYYHLIMNYAVCHKMIIVRFLSVSFVKRVVEIIHSFPEADLLELIKQPK